MDLITPKEHFEINWPLLPEHNGVKGFIKSHFFFIFSKLTVNCDSVKTLIPLRKMQSLLMPRHQSRAVGTVGQDNPFSPPSILADRSKTFPYKRTWITSPKNILRPSYGPVKAVIRENEFESWFTAWLWEISWDWACATIGSKFLRHGAQRWHGLQLCSNRNSDQIIKEICYHLLNQTKNLPPGYERSRGTGHVQR